MSDELASKSFELEIDGKVVQCGFVSSGDRADLRKRIVGERVEIVKDKFVGFNAKALAEIIAKTTAQPVSDAELYSVMGTEEGMQFLLWCGLRKIPGQETWQIERLRDIEPALLLEYANQLYQHSGFFTEDAESDPNAITQIPNYDKHIATIIRYYGLSLGEAREMSIMQIGKFIELLPAVQKALGEDKKL